MQRTRARNVSKGDTHEAIKSCVGRNRKQDEHSEVDKGVTTVELPGFHLLAKKLKSKSFLEIEHSMSTTYKDRSISSLRVDYRCMIDTEHKRLKVIEDLYEIVKAQPQYANLKEPVWNENTQTIEVITWLCRKLSVLAKGEYWFIDKRMVDAKEKHVFVVVKFFHSQKVDFSSFHIPLEFLPLLAKKDAKLHDIIVDTVALMLKQKHVNLWDVEEYSKRALEHTLRITCKSPKEIDELEIYQRGDAMKYLKLIRKRSKVVTNDSVLKMFASYIPDSERKRMTLNWVKMLINLNKYKERMNQFDWYPHYANPSNPFTASKKYFFVWSIHRNSSIQKKADYFYKDDDKKSGEYLPAQVSITSPGQVYKTPVESSYPEDIHAAMKFGWSVLINRFGQYYFKAKDLNEHSLSLQLFNKEKYGTTRSK